MLVWNIIEHAERKEIGVRKNGHIGGRLGRTDRGSHDIFVHRAVQFHGIIVITWY